METEVSDDLCVDENDSSHSPTIVDPFTAAESLLTANQSREFWQLPRSSIQRLAEPTFCNLSKDILATLAENLNYELRCIVSSALLFMKHNNRESFTVEDFNKGISMLLKPEFGYKGLQVFSRNTITKWKTSDVINSRETNVNLACTANSSTKTYQSLEPYVECGWGVLENKACEPYHFEHTESYATDSSEDIVIPDELTKYYDKITEVIHCGQASAFELILSDLQVNPHIGPLLPKFVCFLEVSVSILKNNFQELWKVLQTIEALFMNSYIYLGHEPYLSTVVKCVTDCLLMPLCDTQDSEVDHWVVRDSAAELLAKIVNKWASPVNKLYQITFDKLECVFKNVDDGNVQSEPFCCHYGALKGIMVFGVEAIEKRIYPYMSNYIVHVKKVLSNSLNVNDPVKAEAQAVHNVLLDVAVKITLFYSKKTFNETKCKTPEDNSTVLSQIPLRSLQYSKCGEDVFNQQQCDISQEKIKQLHDMYDLFHKHFGDPFAERVPLSCVTSTVSSPDSTKNVSPDQNCETNEMLFASFKKNSKECGYLKPNKNSLCHIFYNKPILSLNHCDDDCEIDESIFSNYSFEGSNFDDENAVECSSVSNTSGSFSFGTSPNDVASSNTDNAVEDNGTNDDDKRAANKDKNKGSFQVKSSSAESGRIKIILKKVNKKGNKT